jgi:pimeloyl-ACP methyl ester carboxylesterase
MTHIVFLPGLLCTEQLFSGQISNLPEKFASDCITMPVGRTIREISETIWSGVSGKVILLGLSMGGITAMEMYRQHPERILGMVLLDTNSRDEIEAVSEARLKLVDLAKSIGPGEMSLNELLRVLVHPICIEDPFIIKTVYEMAENYGIERLESHGEALSSRQNYSEILTEVSCPVLIMHGSEDQLCPMEFHKHIQSLIPGSRRIEINDCGHLSSLEKPEPVSEYLNNWLEEHFT